MLQINPFPPSFFQAVIDAIVHSAGSIFSAQTLGVVIPFMLKIGVIATLAFALYSFWFKAFGWINSWITYWGDWADSFISNKKPEKKEAIKYEKGIRGKELTEAEKTRPKIAKFVDSM